MTQQPLTLKETLLGAEREAIQDAILAADGHLPTAAGRLGISLRTLHRRIRATGIDQEALGVTPGGRTDLNVPEVHTMTDSS